MVSAKFGKLIVDVALLSQNALPGWVSDVIKLWLVGLSSFLREH